MAQTEGETALLSDLTRQAEKETVVQSEEGVWVGSSPGMNEIIVEVVSNPHSLEKASTTSSESQPSAPLPRLSLVPLGSNAGTTSASAPHPKKFSAVNIGKKFLEKNSAAAGSLPPTSNSSAVKSGGTVSRPTVQTATPHSRLVTAKLTAAPIVPSSTAGWSRPSSVAPSTTTGNTSPNSTSPLPTSAPVSNLTPVAPQLPHVGKVIQPQPRAAVLQLTATQKEPTSSSNKPVWGNVKPQASVARLDVQQNDFPTAAEVAKVPVSVKKAMTQDVKLSVDTAAKQARMEEADTFRGVHLDPNAHHWDEMEEDDDNFLGGVIEFGDGRQYKIESNDNGPKPTSLPLTSLEVQSDSRPPHEHTPSVPVSKQERFVDDFDRSWPRSRTSPSSSAKEFPSTSAPHESSTSPAISPVGLQIASSPQESSRVLFNERSNRLEPYSHSARQVQAVYPSKRSSFHDSSSFVESRSAKDFSSSSSSQNVQVLHKHPVADGGSHNRRFSNGSNGFTAGVSGLHAGQRERDYPTRRDGPPPSPRMQRDIHYPMTSSASNSGRERDFGSERGRRTSMGPPPVPPHALKSVPDGGRQLPPHMAQVSPNILARRLPSRDSRLSSKESASASDQRTPSLPSQSPVISHALLSAVSPVVDSVSPLSILPVADLEEVRKDVMQSAAARAKQRRQQEEAEREAQKERARRKAHELEERMKAAEIEKAKQIEAQDEAKFAILNSQDDIVTAVIEDAIQSVTSMAPNVHVESQGLKSFPRNSSSSQDAPSKAVESMRSPGSKRTAILQPRGSATSPVISPAVQTESWRSKVNSSSSPASSTAPRQIQSRTSLPSFIASPSSALETVVQSMKDNLEVVDFSDMGAFVSVSGIDAVESSSHEAENASATSRRPVASDFFEDTAFENKETIKSDFGTWRRKISLDYGRGLTVLPISETKEDSATVKDTGNEVLPLSTEPASQVSSSEIILEHREEPILQIDVDNSGSTELASNKDTPGQQDRHGGRQVINVPPHSGAQRTPRSQSFYKEAAMSALDDAMSRIKGALVGMQSHETSRELDPEPSQSRISVIPNALKSPQKERWVPPALRLRNSEDEHREVFSVTGTEPPRSPMTSTVVRLPSISRPVDSIHKRQLYIFHKIPFPARFELLSFEPPVEGMSKRDFSVNEVLFRKPQILKGKLKYRVLLPKYKAYSGGPRVQIPISTSGKLNSAFGRPTVADGATSWRKPTIVTKTEISGDAPLEDGLDTMSRSPPPDILPSEVQTPSIPKPSDSTVTKTEVQANVRPRPQPKMPAGSAVAVFRDSRIDVIEADTKSSVNFIVSSEIEDFTDPEQSQPVEATTTSKLVSKGPSSNPFSASKSNATPTIGMQGPNGVAASDDSRSSSIPDTTEVKLSEDMTDRSFTGPPTHQSSSWARASLSVPLKESSSRGPDPEHLKALWSQTSNATELHPVNSLEGIADDFTSLPFTLQDVKSEDGETPPPSVPQPPSRMSLHDVTRAFQQVPQPSSSSNVPPRTPISPPSTNAPVARPTYSYAPLPPNNIRPTYASYPSPMMAHSPAPGVIYSHPMTVSPVPARMQVNGHTPLYSQPMWMTQNPNNMMRPVPSPYPAQMMQYPSSNSPGVYHPPPPPPNMLVNQNPQNGTQTNRSRNMSVMSPVMSHAHVYPASPLLMHTPLMQVPQNHGYMAVPSGRGQPRTDSGQLGLQHVPPAQQPSHVTYTPVPSSPFARSAWS